VNILTPAMENMAGVFFQGMAKIVLHFNFILLFNPVHTKSTYEMPGL
jgi:hypothetical protein